MVVLSRCERHVSSGRATVIEQCRQAVLGPSMDYLFCMAHSRKPSSTALTCARFHHRRATTHCGLHLSISLSKSDLWAQVYLSGLFDTQLVSRSQAQHGRRHGLDRIADAIELVLCRKVAEAAWRKCISGTDWQSLVRKAGRLSDQEQQQLLAQTPLAAAAAKCYAPHPQQRSLCLGEG